VHCLTAPPNGEIGISGPAGNRTWAYDLGDNYAFSLAATGDDHTLAFSLVTPSGDMLLNTNSAARTVDGASRILRSAPASATIAISHDGQTLYTCAVGLDADRRRPADRRARADPRPGRPALPGHPARLVTSQVRIPQVKEKLVRHRVVATAAAIRS
jgi:hypothetical protein